VSRQAWSCLDLTCLDKRGQAAGAHKTISVKQAHRSIVRPLSTGLMIDQGLVILYIYIYILHGYIIYRHGMGLMIGRETSVNHEIM
jgi:hypothetical protein